MAQIKKDTSLRKAILQAAITGQLISNVEGTTETGKELLDRIIEERNKKLLAEWEESLLIFSPRKSKVDEFSNENSRSVGSSNDATSMSLARKNKKTKKPAPVVASEIDEEEIPFEIPENWCWCRASEICDYIVDCPHSTPKYLEVNSGYCAIDTNCINEFGEITQYRFLSDTAYYERVKRLVPKENDIVYTREGSICRAAILLSRNVCLGQRVMLLRPSFGILSRFLQIYLMSPSTINLLTQKSVGMGVQHINVGDVHNLLIPLPPLAVQNAIVAKLEQVLPLVDSYENAILHKEELKSALPDKVKKAILQEAITGQLTESWRESTTIKESGKQLLDRIIEERNAKALAEWEESLKKNPKAKKPVPVVASEIEEEEIPFEVPKSWCWCRLGDICYKIGDIDHKMPKDVIDGIPYISPKDFTEDNIDFLNAKKISQEDFDDLSKKMKPQKGDIIFPRYGTIGIVRLVNVDFNFLVSYSCCTISTMKNLVSEYYIFYMLQSAHIKDEIDKYINKTTQPNVGLESIKHFLIPLPPIEEQKHIVEKIEQLLSLCGELK